MGEGRRTAVWASGAVAACLYLASFALPDCWMRWSGPVGEPGHPGAVSEYYFLPEMVSSFTHAWGRGLDRAAWAGHAAAVAGFALLAAGRGRWSAAAAAFGLVCGLSRWWTARTLMGFLSGHYVWLAGMAALAVAGVCQARRRGNRGRTAASG